MTIDVQIVGSGLIKFEFLVQRLGSREAARDAFEALVEDLIALTHPDVHSVRANPGDWGIDAFVGQLTRGGEVYIWQAKYYIDGFGKVQQADVRASYKSALAAADKQGYVVKGWTLCIPTTLDAPNTKWWQGWVSRTKDGVVKELWDEGVLRRRLHTEAATSIRNAYFAPVFAVDGVSDSKQLANRALQILADESAYQDALFVRQMLAAELSETFEAREAFFNAEILTHEIQDKGLPDEEAALQNWRVRAAATWGKNYNNALQAHPGLLLPGLYAQVMDEIEQRHTQESAALRASPVHGFGLMHQAVDAGRAGWTRDWRSRIDPNDAGSEDAGA